MKCHLLEIEGSAKRPNWECKIGTEAVSKAREGQDLGVIIYVICGCCQKNISVQSLEEYVDC